MASSPFCRVWRVAVPAMRLCVFFVCLVCLEPVDGFAQTINVFLVGGQSNADGRAETDGLPADLASPQEDVPFYYGISKSGSEDIRKQGLTTLRPGFTGTDQFGPELMFGKSMAEFYKVHGGRIAVIKYANGGTNLAEDWKAGGTNSTTGDGVIYRNFQSVVKAGMDALHAEFPQARLKISGMIWMQGESDSNASSTRYRANLAAFLRDIRRTYGADLPVVIGQLSDKQTGTNKNAGGTTADRDRVRAAQAAVAEADPHAALVVTDSFAVKSDHLHFNKSGQLALGSAFAEQMRKLVEAP